MRPFRRALASTLMAAAIGPFAAPARATAEPTSCRPLDVPVPGGDAGAKVRLHGELCTPPGATVVQVLVHGATFDRAYWSPPADRPIASYQRAANLAGYATFAFDRPGSGASDAPPSGTVTIDAEITLLHAIVQHLRAGDLGAAPAFPRVVTVGHSLGSILALFEAGRHHDVDGLVLTGFSHADSTAAQHTFFAALHPASREPRFAGLDAGYATTVPGARKDLFFAFDPRSVGATTLAPQVVLDFDEAHKGTLAAGELTPPPESDPSAAVAVPVLVVSGALDPFGCGANGCTAPRALAARERAAFVASPAVEALVIAGTGHALNFLPTAPLFFAAAQRWVGAHVPATRGAGRSGASK